MVDGTQSPEGIACRNDTTVLFYCNEHYAIDNGAGTCTVSYHKYLHRSVYHCKRRLAGPDTSFWFPIAGIIIIAGIFVPLLVHYVAQTADQREA